MDRLGPTLIAAACAVLALYLMYFGWKRRRARDADLGVVHAVPADPGELLAAVAGFYVVTTVHENPFERLAVAGLGFRARAEIAVHATGVVVRIPGEEDIFIAASAIERVAQATWAIDRVVERNGLVLLAWVARTLDPSAATTPTIVDSYFRIVELDDRENLISAIEQIAPSAGKAKSTTESEV
jgi:hypothetical protein